MRILIVSNLDSSKPFGQYTRPFFLGREMAKLGHEIANVGVDCARVRFGPAWSTGSQTLPKLARATALARRSFEPEVIYAHQNMPAAAALIAADGVPVAADFHSLPSVEWAGLASTSSGVAAMRHRSAWLRALVAERAIARRADGLVAAAPGVAEEIVSRYHPRHQPHVVANGVDHELLEAPRMPDPPFDRDGAAAHAVTTLPASASAMNRRALDFLAEIAGLLEARAPELAVHVVGSEQGPAPGLLRYHGLVPALEPWLDHADVCLLPYPADAIHVGGAKNKLMEYLARGRRIVTTPEGIRGLEEAADLEGVTVVPYEAEAFAAAVAAAVAPGAASLETSRAAVSRRYRWDVLAREVVEALQAVPARP